MLSLGDYLLAGKFDSFQRFSAISEYHKWLLLIKCMQGGMFKRVSTRTPMGSHSKELSASRTNQDVP